MDELDNILDLTEERERMARRKVENARMFEAAYHDRRSCRHRLVMDSGLVRKVWSVLEQLPERK
jgi:hypothetical protein